ncbi:MAG: ferredoxin family protein [Phycisphaerae bacterium]|nr:ferredoxin family protein [Phycisphaerae bacterium]
MTSRQTEKRPHVVFCSCAHYETIPGAVKERVFSSLRDAGMVVEAVADLCGMAADRHPRLRHWAQAEPLSIVACFPRAIRWLFEAAGAPLDLGRTRLFNMRTQSPEEIARELLKGAGSGMIEEKSVPSASNHQSSIEDHQSDWVPWFPVIDYERCRNCKQCVNFCLFGVYGLSDEGRVQVQNPAGCKTNCPACARMCPASAIIFPKYADSPINGDDVAPSPQAQSESPRDLRRLLQGDVYDKIRRREPGRKRFSTEAPDPAPGGPCPTLDALRRDLDIPDDVLASLSGAELQRIRVEANKGRAQEKPRDEAGGKKESRNA